MPHIFSFTFLIICESRCKVATPWADGFHTQMSFAFPKDSPYYSFINYVMMVKNSPHIILPQKNIF